MLLALALRSFSQSPHGPFGYLEAGALYVVRDLNDKTLAVSVINCPDYSQADPHDAAGILPVDHFPPHLQSELAALCGSLRKVIADCIDLDQAARKSPYFPYAGRRDRGAVLSASSRACW